MGVEYQIDMSLFESINEDGHTDVASSKRKVMIMVDDSNKLLNKLNGMMLVTLRVVVRVSM